MGNISPHGTWLRDLEVPALGLGRLGGLGRVWLVLGALGVPVRGAVHPQRGQVPGVHLVTAPASDLLLGLGEAVASVSLVPAEVIIQSQLDEILI